MRPVDPIARSFSFFLPISLIAILAVRCSNNEPSGSSDSVDAMDHNERPMDGTSTMDQKDHTANANMDTDQNGTAVSVDVKDELYYERPSATMTPAEERVWATTDMSRLRAALVADLEEVRDRLNVGSSPAPQHDKDQALAADLAQGLERVDRAMVALNASTDATWGSVRESQLKEVADVREWMRGYRKDHVMAKK